MLECQSVTLGPPSKPAFLVRESSIKESEIPIREVSRVETPSANESTGGPSAVFKRVYNGD
ncbi:hypothetical protein QJS10_CPB11g01168 [Acorus calamus]|uniref:Uncharacterized protein n=1 Tax=Acorus calamus TaxID=4465 RepID=A0AAV9DRX7_ACOCL|nr:hypothetical protein QJS10_CPB11g01168 [Acorus calamus]